MSSPYNAKIDVAVTGGPVGLHIRIDGRSVDHAYGALGWGELAALREFHLVRVDVNLSRNPAARSVYDGRLINTELHRNEIWD